MRDAAVTLCTMAMVDGVPQEITFEAVARTLAIVLKGESEDTFSKRRSDNIAATTGARATKEAIANSVMSGMLKIGIPFRFIEAFARIIAAGAEGFVLYITLFSHGLGMILDRIDTAAGGRLSRDFREIIEILTEEASLRGGRTKNSWAPLASKDFERLRFADWVALGLHNKMEVEETSDPLSTTIKNLNRFVPLGQEELPENIVYKRPVHLPLHPRASTLELKYPSLLHSVAAVVDPTLQKRAEMYERMGAKQGIDGVWLSDDDARDAQIKARYLPEGRPWNMDEEVLMEATVQALYTAHKDAFKQPGVVTPEVVARNLIKKYSPGLPFIPRFKRRSELWSTGWMDSIIQLTYESLQNGVFPTELYHAFPKMQIVTKARMITAEALTSVFVAQVAQLETTKRSFWDQANMGMGAPITPRYLGEIFEKVNGRKMTFSADATDWDSNCPPILFEALTRLWEAGVKDGGIPAVASIQRAKYVAMQNALIVDLPTGKVYAKNRGGATGQSSTSWDNHWAFRCAMVMMWCYVTGKAPDTFYDFNTVHNTGDDNIWGTDSEIDPEDLRKAAKDLFGMDFKIETRGDITNLIYLARRPVRTQDVYDDAVVAGLENQEFVAAPDRSRILLRRSAALSRVSGGSLRKFSKNAIQRGIGHLTICAFDRVLYSTILREYMEDVETYLGVKNSVMWNVVFDKDGLAVGCSPEWRSGFRPSRNLQSRFNQLASSLKAPSYEEVLKMSGRPIDRSPKLGKFYAAKVNPTFERVLRDWVVVFRTNLYRYVPDSITKLAVSPDSAPIAPLLWTPGWPVEKYVWRSAIRRGEDLTYDQLAANIRMSPFGPATDAAGFWWFTQVPGMKEKLLAEDYHVVRGRMVASYFMYHVCNNLLAILRRIPVVGLVVEGWLMYQIDIPRLYAALSSIHWVATGTVSNVLSALIPRDPYSSLKIAAVWSTLVVPDVISRVLSVLLPEDLTVGILETIVLFKKAHIFRKVDAAEGVRPQNEWDAIIEDIMALGTNWGPGVSIVAETATGKSTKFPAALIKSTGRRVWLLTHRVILRETYSNPWLAPCTHVELARGVIDTGDKLVVTTYGHYLARVKGGNGPEAGDIILMDEFHEREPDMGLAYHITIKNIKFLLSATPNNLYAPHAKTYVVPIKRPYVEPTPVRLSLDTMGLVNEALRDHKGDQRLLVIVRGVNEAHAVARGIASLGRITTVVMAQQRRLPEVGDIVATQVVDSGINIPGITILIDSGMRVVSHHGSISVRPTDPSVDRQRRGRVGRYSDGWVYTTIVAGTGEEPTPYPTYTRLMEETISREWLLNILEIKDDLIPYPFLEASRIDVRMKILPKDLNTNELVSLSAWWCFACSNQGKESADVAYDRVLLQGWTEHDEAISQMLSRTFGQTGLIPRLLLAPLLAGFPFEINRNGVKRRVLGLTFIEGEVRDF